MIRKLDLLPIFAIAMSRAENVVHARMLGIIFSIVGEGRSNLYLSCPIERCTPILDKFIELCQARSTPQEITQEIHDTMLTVFTIGLRGMQARPSLNESRVGKLWILLGIHTKVYERYRGRNRQPLEVSDHLPGHNAYFKACGWKACLCSHKRPSHSMRVCRGCWVTHYCSIRCQER